MIKRIVVYEVTVKGSVTIETPRRHFWCNEIEKATDYADQFDAAIVRYEWLPEGYGCGILPTED